MNLKHTLILTLSLLSLSAAHAAAPTNDSILKAIKLSGNYSNNPAQDISLGTADAMDPLLSGASAGKTLWYVFPHYPTTNNLRLIVTSTTAVGKVTAFQALDPENPRGSLRQLSSVPLSTGQKTTVDVSYSGNAIYLMLAGTGQCSVTHRISASSYDFPSEAYPLSGTKGSVHIDNLTASNTADEPALPAGAVAMYNIVWFKWTPNFNGLVYFDTNFSYSGGAPQFSINSPPPLHNTQIAVYASTSGGTADALSALVANDSDGYGGQNSRVSTLVFSGSTYYIAVGTVSGASGSIYLQHYSSISTSEIYFNGYDLSSSSEGAGSHSVIVRRRYAASGTDSCTLATSNGTATAGSDYLSLSTTVSFTAPSSNKSSWEFIAPVTLIQDSVAEAKYEDVNVTLSASSPGSAITGSNPAHFNIWDDETGDNPDLILSSESFRVRESDAPLAIQVQRKYFVDASFINLVQTNIGGTASNPQDFDVSASSQINAHQSASMIYFIPVNDNVFEGDETVTVNVAGMVSYDVIIEDDDFYIPVPGKLTTSLSYASDSRRAVLYSTVSTLGALSGKLTILDQTLAFSGKLDNRGKFQVALAPKGRGIFYLTLAAQDSLGHMKVELLDSTAKGSNSSLDSSVAMIQNFSTLNPCPLTGTYTVLAGSLNDGTSAVSCAGAASCKINVSGNAVFTGKLFDGSAFTAAGYVDGEGQVSAMAALYARLGYMNFSGDIPLTAGSTSNLSLKLNRPARANDPLKFGAIASGLTGTCARYTPPTKGLRVLDSWSAGTGKATLTGAPLAMTLTKALTISTMNVITTPVDGEKLKLTVVPATGMFSGSFVLPGTTKIMPIFGALSDLPGQNGTGRGYFFDGKSGGTITIGQP